MTEHLKRRVFAFAGGLFATCVLASPAKADSITAPHAEAPRAELVTADAADAADTGEADATTAATERRWYGWQTLLTDAAAIATTPLAGQDDGVALVPLLIFGLGAPVVHGAHGHGGKALGSLGMRAVPIVLSAAYFSSDCFRLWGPDVESSGCQALAATAVLSLPAAIVIDAAVLAHEDVPQRTLSFAPWVDPKRSTSGVVVAGSF